MKRIASIGFGLGLLALMGAPIHAEDKSAFTSAQKDEIRKLVRDYLISNPEVLNEAINALQAKEDTDRAEKAAALISQYKDQIFDASDGTIIGNPKGDVTMVEFFDYNCGYCKKMFPEMMDVVKSDGKVRLIMKEFPVLGPPSVVASRAALAARKQNKYTEFHLAMMAHKGAVTDDAVMEVAQSVGLDMKKLQADMQDPAVNTLISKNRKLGSELALDGTPALIVGHTLVPGAIEKQRIAELITAERK